jgi:DNA-binding LytR/AlgR family response regulator
MKLKCIIVDDESLARKLIEENIRQLPFLELVGMCKNPFEAMHGFAGTRCGFDVFGYTDARYVGNKISAGTKRKANGHFYHRVFQLCRGKL